MPTPAVKATCPTRWLFREGERLTLADIGYIVESRAGRGGFGEVYIVRRSDGSGDVCVGKFLRTLNDFVHKETPAMAAEIVARQEKMFEREWRELRRLAGLYPKCFPAFYGAGRHGGRAYYLMEKLDVVGNAYLRGLDTDERRMRFIGDLCRAVGALHENGLVHFDIKPQNILLRKKSGDYVLGDFGSVHSEEQHKEQGASAAQKTEYTISLLSDGRRILPRTIGYCDPIDSSHTKHADIYAIGQVMRDMFFDEVPALWARIILKCINRNFGMRYDSVDQVLQDVLGMGGDGATRLANELSNILSPEGAAWLRERKRVYVSASAPRGGDGTEQRPFRTISAALKAAKPDSAVLVQGGVYKEAICLAKRRVDLIALAGPKETVIQGKPGFAAVRITKGADGSRVKGFSITGGTGVACKSTYGFDYYGGGINANVSAAVEDCVIFGNGKGEPQKDACTFGGGACVSGATVTFRNCRICDNFAWASGGGLMADGAGAALVIVGCTIEGNGSMDFFGIQGGIALANSATLSVSDSIVCGNAGDQIGAYGNVHANGTRAQVERSYVEGEPRACNIPLFIARPDNYKTMPKDKGLCGCKEEIAIRQ